MNREATKKAIEVMQAYVDGADFEVQAKYDTIWHMPKGGDTTPQWNFQNRNYRIKLKPREFWITIEPPGETLVAWSVEPMNIDGTRIKVREVIE